MKTKIRSFVVISAITALFALPVMAQSAPSLSKRENIPGMGIPSDILHLPLKELDTPSTSIVVTTLEDSETDDGLCSLREAVRAANENMTQDACPAGGLETDSITFSDSGTITLSAGELHVSSSGPLIIDGSSETVNISGGNSSRVFGVDPGVNLLLINLSMINGKADNGGAVYNGGYLWLENCTLSGNQAITGSGRGGAIYNSGTVYLINSTLSANQAISGGGVFNTGWLYVSSVTLTNNSASSSGGGIYSQDYWFYLKNTILAKNSAANGPDCYGNKVSSNRYNLVGNWNGCSLYPTTGDLIGIDPRLGPLQDNGGGIFTHALLSGSLAIDHGNPGGCQDYGSYPLTTDQRGLPRSGRCDIGAYESQRETAAEPYTLFLPCVQRGCSNILFFDDFSTQVYGWTVGDFNYGSFEYLNGEYRMNAKVSPAWLGSRSGHKYTDYILEVDVRNASGTFGYYGLLFEFAEDWSQYYVFQIDTNGRYVIFLFNSDNSGGWLSDGYSPSIHTGTATNHLKLERNGSQIWAYANGELLTVLPEATSTESRYVGLFTIADPTPNVDSRYDNFTVESISCGASYSYPVLAEAASDDNARELYSPKNWELAPQILEINE